MVATVRGLASNAAWTVLGLGLGAANALRHRAGRLHTPRRIPRLDAERNARYDLSIVDVWRRTGLEPGGRHILEIGPGTDLGTGVALLALGAASYTAIDRFPLAREGSLEVSRAVGRAFGVDGERLVGQITYIAGDFPPRVSVPAIDVFLSNAALEHVDDVHGLFGWMSQVSAPASSHIHVVDPQTHMRWLREGDPWNILRYPDWLYRSLLSFAGSPNRLLLSDYLAAGARAGITFRVAEADMVPDAYLRRVRPWLARRFRRRPVDDLIRRSFTLVGEGTRAPESTR